MAGGNVETLTPDLRSALFVQAKSDYEIYKLLNVQGAPLCHRLHYLQMLTEKLSKGYKTPPGSKEIKHTHKALVSFIRTAKGRRDIQAACGFTRSEQYEGYLNSLLPIAYEVENLAPSESQEGPNPEYPWIQGEDIIAPVNFEFPKISFTAANVIRLVGFIDNCLSLTF